ncbi:MAG: hypothetical protein OMM_09852 [Candidatus Magnetoglobus multicellularis str. Araruama]|uniref:Uncharacterized protein n=1 Tax=Candidatus Magnetoglobus multicellularis str. Araruama TaxID=890399 RepID=A0A1V1P2X9_9BACT|nr:MAG: hypothetical protein OMM_09852 [Candidatus Magnetoglobus multicellularis str. Araruama]
MNKLTKHIKVSPPYYALKNVQLLKNNTAYFSAEIPVEYPAGNECGSITAAEIGRHLAILGSCSLSQSNPIKEKHYYIANKATLNCLCKEKVISKNSEFIGEAKTLSINKKKVLPYLF